MANYSRKPASSGTPSFTGEELFVALHGKEQFLRSEYFHQLQKVMEQKHDPIDVLRFNGKSVELAEVLDELRSVGLMMQHKLVLVDQASDFIKKYRTQLENYAKAPEPTATLVLRSEKWNRGNLDKHIAKVGVVIKCDAVTENAAGRWVQKRATGEYQCKISGAASGLLVERVGVDLGRLDSELAKLAVSIDSGKAIEVGDVEQLVGRASEKAAWEIQEALLSGSAEKAISKLHELVDLANQPEVLVLYFVADMVKKLHRASVMLNTGRSQGDVCKELKLWGDRSNAYMHAARKLGQAGTARLLGMIVDIDRKAKSGYGKHTPHLERFAILFTRYVR